MNIKSVFNLTLKTLRDPYNPTNQKKQYVIIVISYHFELNAASFKYPNH